MTDFQNQAHSLILQTLKIIHSTLSKHPSSSSEARDLSSLEHHILQNLNPNSFLYQTFVTILAIHSYAMRITKQASLLQEIPNLLKITLNQMHHLEQSINERDKNSDLKTCYKEAQGALLQIVKIQKNICPQSFLASQMDDILKIKTGQNRQKYGNQTVERLREQNEYLREQLIVNDERLLEMEEELTKLLEESNQNYEQFGKQSAYFKYGTQNRNSELKYLKVREELAMKDAEIVRMNQEFSYQIQKYNTVYDALKRQLEELKAYQNIDLIEQIELLETEIVRLREERERDQLIMRQIRNDRMAPGNPQMLLSPKSRIRSQHPQYF